MNKIILSNNNYEIVNEDLKLDFIYENDYINKIKNTVNKSTKLELIFKDEIDKKFDISFEIEDNVKFNLIEIKKNCKVKILFKYNLKKSSNANIIKVNDINSINEKNIINLNDINASIKLLLKTVSKNIEKYDFAINHNSKNTNSEIINNGINLSGNLYFTVSSYIPKGNCKCIANQNNRIINLTNNECLIKPNLLIDEYDVIANHSAVIGSFKDEEIFYLERLGINKTLANKLLIEGFLKSKLNKTLANHFKKYWR